MPLWRSLLPLALTASCAMGAGFDEDEAGLDGAAEADVPLSFDVPPSIDLVPLADAADDAGGVEASSADAAGDAGDVADERPAGPCA